MSTTTTRMMTMINQSGISIPSFALCRVGHSPTLVVETPGAPPGAGRRPFRAHAERAAPANRDALCLLLWMWLSQTRLEDRLGVAASQIAGVDATKPTG